ncbi:MAG: DUF885 domain-containing protein [Candidatus Eisenbacteria bacterium]|nr:DUF885 domain-containing protein [Candidatus Eisenbacteria bacterium]
MSSRLPVRVALSIHSAPFRRTAWPGRLALSCLAACLILAPFISPRPTLAATRAEFDGFVDQFIDGWYAFRPVEATRAGVHRHDMAWSGYTRESIEAEIVRLKGAHERLNALAPAGLDTARVVDRDILLGRIQGEILDLETIRPWEKNPGYYVDMVTEGIYNLIARSFAPAPERLASVIARENQISGVLAASLENLVNPPRIWTQVSIEQAKGAVEFLKTAVPAAFADVTDPKLRADFEASNAMAIRDLESYVQFLEGSVLPAANGSYQLGEVNFQAKLLHEEMCDIPIYRLEKIGEEHLKALQSEVGAVAAAIDKDKTPAELYRILSIDHPKPSDLVATTNSLLEDLRSFCVTKNLVSIPGEERCRAVATPEFMRNFLFAAMDSPGPFETKGREAWYFVTPPDPGKTAIEQDDAMRLFNRYSLPILSMHEAWPGHYLQFLRGEQTSSKVRRVFGSASFSEGWGLYCEQMMLEQGWGDGDPRYKLFQLRLALLRSCRYLVAIRMHTGQMTMEEAVEFFMKEGYTERIDAEREARRGTLDPTYLVYQLGKLQIHKARDDYKRFRGAAFTLKEFHDRLLSFGEPPVKLLRRLLMPGDKGTLL